MVTRMLTLTLQFNDVQVVAADLVAGGQAVCRQLQQETTEQAKREADTCHDEDHKPHPLVDRPRGDEKTDASPPQTPLTPHLR